MKAGLGIRNGTGDEATGRDDKPDKDAAEPRAPKLKLALSKKAQALKKLKQEK